MTIRWWVFYVGTALYVVYVLAPRDLVMAAMLCGWFGARLAGPFRVRRPAPAGGPMTPTCATCRYFQSTANKAKYPDANAGRCRNSVLSNRGTFRVWESFGCTLHAPTAAQGAASREEPFKGPDEVRVADRAAVRAWLDKRIAAWSGTRDAARLLQREAVYEETLLRHCRAANEADVAINVLRAERDALRED